MDEDHEKDEEFWSQLFSFLTVVAFLVFAAFLAWLWLG